MAAAWRHLSSIDLSQCDAFEPSRPKGWVRAWLRPDPAEMNQPDETFQPHVLPSVRRPNGERRRDPKPDADPRSDAAAPMAGTCPGALANPSANSPRAISRSIPTHLDLTDWVGCGRGLRGDAVAVSPGSPAGPSDRPGVNDDPAADPASQEDVASQAEEPSGFGSVGRKAAVGRRCHRGHRTGFQSDQRFDHPNRPADLQAPQRGRRGRHPGELHRKRSDRG